MKRQISIVLILALFVFGVTGCASMFVSTPHHEESPDITVNVDNSEDDTIDSDVPDLTDEIPIMESLVSDDYDVDIYWAEDGAAWITDEYDEYTSTGAVDPTVGVMIVPREKVTKFKFLDIQLENVTEDGDSEFSVIEQVTFATLVPERPLVVYLSMIGTIPNNGISFVNSLGNTRYFAIVESGKDGSVMLQEFYNPTFG